MSKFHKEKSARECTSSRLFQQASRSAEPTAHSAQTRRGSDKQPHFQAPKPLEGMAGFELQELFLCSTVQPQRLHRCLSQCCDPPAGR